MNLDYRPARKEDARECLVLRGKTRQNPASEEFLRSIGVTEHSWAEGIRTGSLPGHVCTCDGRIVGYCFGGLLTWLSACELDGVNAAVAYYGGGIGGEVDRSPRCPVMMHFGELDAHIPLTEVEKVRSAHPEAEVFVYAADHGFNCDHRASYDADAAALARTRTLEFFDKHLAG